MTSRRPSRKRRKRERRAAARRGMNVEQYRRWRDNRRSNPSRRHTED